MREILTTYAGPILFLLIAIDLVVSLIWWIRSPRFREGWRRRTLFDDTFGFNFWIENRWYLLFSVVVFGLFFWVVSLSGE